MKQLPVFLLCLLCVCLGCGGEVDSGETTSFEDEGESFKSNERDSILLDSTMLTGPLKKSGGSGSNERDITTLLTCDFCLGMDDDPYSERLNCGSTADSLYEAMLMEVYDIWTEKESGGQGILNFGRNTRLKSFSTTIKITDKNRLWACIQYSPRFSRTHFDVWDAGKVKGLYLILGHEVAHLDISSALFSGSDDFQLENERHADFVSGRIWKRLKFSKEEGRAVLERILDEDSSSLFYPPKAERIEAYEKGWDYENCISTQGSDCKQFRLKTPSS